MDEHTIGRRWFTLERLTIPALTAISLLAYAGLVSVHFTNNTLTHQHLPQTMRWFYLAFVAYGLTIYWTERQYHRGKTPISPRYLWGGAILFHVLLLFTVPTLSSDVYRYLWDGYVANNGVSPYAFPIDSPQLDYLDAPIRAQANHTWMASPYLPAAQTLFGTVTWLLPPTPLSMQIALVGVNLFNGILIVALLSIANLPCHRVLIYLWNPLVIVEIAQGAHIDGWMTLLALLAVWAAMAGLSGSESISGCLPERRATARKTFTFGDSPLMGIFPEGGYPFLQNWLSPILLALATLTKIIPGFLMVVLFWHWQSWARWRAIALYLITIAVLIVNAGMRGGWGLVGELDGHGLFAALRIYGDRWNFNSGLFHWLEVGLMNDALLGLSLEDANQWAKRIVALLLLTVLFTVWLYTRKQTSPRAMLRLMAVPLMGYVLLTTTFHPWYLLMLLAFVPFLPPAQDEPAVGWLDVMPWLYLSSALFLSYFTYFDPQDLREYEWIRRTEWLPTLGLLLVSRLRK
ncbi:MAG: hypothetical protein AAF639_28660 [Chloroflexota bacterium]